MKIILESILPLLVLLPLTFFFLIDKRQIKTFGLFSLVFIFYQIILRLPVEFNELQIIHGKWNWTGKTFGIVFGLLAYLFLRQKLKPFDFLRFRQNPKTLKKTFLLTLIPVFTALFSYFGASKQFDMETLLYELTMPGFDEEIMFRGILLGLLLTCFKDKIIIKKRTFGNPSVLFVGLLFGLVHGIGVTNSNKLVFEIYPFLWTFIVGYIWSLIAVESKSILQPIISHNLNNFLQHFITMIK